MNFLTRTYTSYFFEVLEKVKAPLYNSHFNLHNFCFRTYQSIKALRAVSVSCILIRPGTGDAHTCFCSRILTFISLEAMSRLIFI